MKYGREKLIGQGVNFEVSVSMCSESDRQQPKGLGFRFFQSFTLIFVCILIVLASPLDILLCLKEILARAFIFLRIERHRQTFMDGRSFFS